MDASPSLDRRFHPERAVLLGALALLLAVLAGFVLGVLATTGFPAARPGTGAQHSASPMPSPTPASGLRTSGDGSSLGDIPPDPRRESPPHG